MSKYTGHIDWLILLPVAGLMLFGISFVYSASAAFAAVKTGSSETMFWNHALRILVGLVIIIVFSRIDYRIIKKYSHYGLFAAIACLALVLLIGRDVKGASRWLDIGPLSFQPSELAKFALIGHLSLLIGSRDYSRLDFKTGMLPLLGWVAVVCGLIALQPNLSTASVIFLLSWLLMFIGNVRSQYLIRTAVVGIIIAGAYAVSAPYRLRRILAFIGYGEGTESEVVNYQLKQALIAFGSGGLFGVGPGESIQREFFLPESYGDFIFSVVGEEYGYFLGVLPIIVAFGVITWRGMRIAKNAPDMFGTLLATGITSTLALYGFINAGVTCGILPTTGLPMPFISYGGTSVLFSAAAVGVLLNISAQSGVYPRKKIITAAPPKETEQE